jgi:hypothetical protein
MEVIWIVAIIAVPVLLIVAGAVVYQWRKDGGTLANVIGVRPLTFVSILAFAFATLGPLMTAFGTPAPVGWWKPLALRVAWTLGGSGLLALSVLREVAGSWRPAALWVELRRAERLLRALLVGVTLAGAALSFNSALDLVLGPRVVRGLPTLEVHKGSRRISVTLDLATEESGRVSLDFQGLQANRVEAEVARCRHGRPLEVVMLRHVEVLLEVTCR